MTRKLAALTFVAVVTLVGQTAAAQIPRLISFQGRLADIGGNPLSGNHSVWFRIYPAASGGTACFAENQASVPVNAGLFKVLIGAATGGGIGAGCDFSVPYWLEVQVDTDNPMTPRLPFTTATYALSADTIGGRHASGYALKETNGDLILATNARLGVGQSSPAQLVDANGNIKATQFCLNGACRSTWTRGTVTSVTAGTGISLSQSPLTSSGTISVNTSAIQQRVTGTCANGAIATIAANGTVTCINTQAVTECDYSGRKYTPGAKCRVGSTTTCSIDNCSYTEYSCGSNGSWSTYTTCNAYCAPAC
jgi:hypothetical protein